MYLDASPRNVSSSWSFGMAGKALICCLDWPSSYPSLPLYDQPQSNSTDHKVHPLHRCTNTNTSSPFSCFPSQPLSAVRCLPIKQRRANICTLFCFRMEALSGKSWSLVRSPDTSSRCTTVLCILPPSFERYFYNGAVEFKSIAPYTANNSLTGYGATSKSAPSALSALVDGSWRRVTHPRASHFAGRILFFPRKQNFPLALSSGTAIGAA